MPGWFQWLSASRYFAAACTNSDSLRSALPSRNRSSAAFCSALGTPKTHGRSPFRSLLRASGSSDCACFATAGADDCARANGPVNITTATKAAAPLIEIVIACRPLSLQLVEHGAAELRLESRRALLFFCEQRFGILLRRDRRLRARLGTRLRRLGAGAQIFGVRERLAQLDVPLLQLFVGHGHGGLGLGRLRLRHHLLRLGLAPRKLFGLHLSEALLGLALRLARRHRRLLGAMLRVADDDERDDRGDEQTGEEHATADGRRLTAPRRARVELEDRLQEVALLPAELAAITTREAPRLLYHLAAPQKAGIAPL